MDSIRSLPGAPDGARVDLTRNGVRPWSPALLHGRAAALPPPPPSSLGSLGGPRTERCNSPGSSAGLRVFYSGVGRAGAVSAKPSWRFAAHYGRISPPPPRRTGRESTRKRTREGRGRNLNKVEFRGNRRRPCPMKGRTVNRTLNGGDSEQVACESLLRSG